MCFGLIRCRSSRPRTVVFTILLLGAAVRGQNQPPALRVDLDQAIQLALAHNHALRAARTQIQQSRAEEITASLRPNPVFTYDDLFLPIFSPHSFNSSTLDNITEFDAGFSYTIERGHKRQARIRAARDQTAVTRSQVSDNERTLKSNLDLAKQDLASFQETVNISEARYKAGDISEGDLLKIKLQMLQFRTDVSSAELNLVQARASLRGLLGYDAAPEKYDVVGELTYAPLHGNKEDLQATALGLRPDLRAAEQGVTAAQSQYELARANGKRDLTTALDYTHVSALNNASMFFNIEVPIFNRNQGEIARTRYAMDQSQENKTATQETVLTDVTTAYEAAKEGETVVKLYQSGYLKQAQDSRDISEYAYKRGAASLLDFLDAERSYRATQLAYRQSLASYMLALEQLREAVGTRTLP